MVQGPILAAVVAVAVLVGVLAAGGLPGRALRQPATPPASPGAAATPAAVTSAATPVAFPVATPEADAATVIEVGGLVARPLRLTAADLRRLRSRAVDVAWMTTDDRNERAVFRGVPLQVVLELAEPLVDLQRAGEVDSYVIVSGQDGYRAVVAWGEIAPRLAQRPVILAWEQNGQPLPPERQPAQLIVPGDKRDERAVAGVARIDLVAAEETPPPTPVS